MHDLTSFLSKPHHIFTDSFYTTEKLVVSMAARNIGMTGTVNKQICGVPKGLCEKNYSESGPVFTQKIYPNCNLVLCTWLDTNLVKVLSSVYGLKIDDVKRRKGNGKETVQ